MNYCMSCGAQLQPEWRFCGNCRRPVGEGREQAESAAAPPPLPGSESDAQNLTGQDTAAENSTAETPRAPVPPAAEPPAAGAPTVITPSSGNGAGGSGSGDGSGGSGSGGGPGSAANGDGEPRKKPSRKTIVLASLAVVLVVVGVGAFLFIQNMIRGGAGSPEQVAEKLIESVEAKDGIGLVTMVAPAERESLNRLREGLTEKVEEFGILEAANKVGEDLEDMDDDISFDGITVTFENVEPDITEVDDQLAVMAFSSGSVRVQMDPEETTGAIRSALEAAGEMDPVDETTELSELGLDGDPLLMAAVKDGGRWYLSPLYTGLEFVTQSMGNERGSLPEATDGAGSPAEAAQDLIGAVPGIVQSGKFTDLGNYLVSYEGNAVHYYGRALNEAMEGGSDVDLQVTTNTFKDTDQDGDRGRATVETLEADVEGDSLRVTADCMELEGSDEMCRGKSGYVMLEGDVDGDAVVRALPPLGLTTLKEDGGWKVSVMESTTDWTLQWLDSITREQALAMLDLARSEDTAGTLVLGEDTELKFNSAGYAVMKLELDEDVILDSTDEYSSLTVYSPDGKETITSSDDYQREETPAGEYKVVVFAGEDWADKFASDGNGVDYSATMTFEGVVEPPMINDYPGEEYGYLTLDDYPGPTEELIIEVPKGNDVELVLQARGSYSEWDEPGSLVATLDGKEYTVPVGNTVETVVIPVPDDGKVHTMELELVKGTGSGEEVDYTLDFVEK
ncbi:zinc ribbon domain-containing protein [Arthrobacter sp. ATA002]|uniref:zinc ribbon domain-containing protein n=1 Tax=Arthrobacter sp. ATA002 TaxID=2991715 RepID=UPI0022A79F6E|nr:zinc ribbon domain-containing protein [Arthrobacter sp. ATA002]WAP51405.1 zinc ribbon domain-containing protein [Arthrobacter sp. ATA002]